MLFLIDHIHFGRPDVAYGKERIRCIKT